MTTRLGRAGMILLGLGIILSILGWTGLARTVRGQPLLVGTTSVELSERLSKRLWASGLRSRSLHCSRASRRREFCSGEWHILFDPSL